jgi:ribosomal protein S18 acetylase RimI-like enzyme
VKGKLDYQIEKAELEDMAEILQLQYEAYRSEAMLYDDFAIPPLTQTLEQSIEDYHTNTILKAVQNGKILGSVRAYAKQDTAYIGKLMVLPSYQGQGIGKALMREIENEFSGKKYELFTGEKSKKNLVLYERLGYVRSKEIEIKPGLTYIYLTK